MCPTQVASWRRARQTRRRPPGSRKKGARRIALEGDPPGLGCLLCQNAARPDRHLELADGDLELAVGLFFLRLLRRRRLVVVQLVELVFLVLGHVTPLRRWLTAPLFFAITSTVHLRTASL